MNDTTWEDISNVHGDIKPDIEAAVEHLEWTFFDSDIVHLVGLRPKTKKNSVNVFSVGDTLPNLITSIRESLDDLITPPWSIYYQIAPSTEIVQGQGVRPDKNVCAGTRVLFADLDVKRGAFESKEEVMFYIENMKIPPGAVVWTGTGGAHVTWRLDPAGAMGLRSEFTGRQIGERWWTYLDSELKRLSIDATVDRLVDLDARVLRLPGTIRYPKYPGDVTAPVWAQYFDVPDISYESFREITDKTFEPYEARVKKRKRDDQDLTIEMLDITGKRGSWSDLMLLAMIDEIAEENLTWDEILSEYGWTFLRSGGDGSKEWTRPGGDGKSATTDWPDSPGIMSLFSTDPSTGLLDLYEAEIPLTKWRVFLRLIHDDNAYEALDDLGLRAKGRT